MLDRIAAGEANARIADKLGLSEESVRSNVSSILAKLLVADPPTRRPAGLVLGGGRNSGVARGHGRARSLSGQAKMAAIAWSVLYPGQLMATVPGG